MDCFLDAETIVDDSNVRDYREPAVFLLLAPNAGRGVPMRQGSPRVEASDDPTRLCHLP
jgi:hypothetical protein